MACDDVVRPIAHSEREKTHYSRQHAPDTAEPIHQEQDRCRSLQQCLSFVA
jgi:hypothetical protein